MNDNDNEVSIANYIEPSRVLHIPGNQDCLRKATHSGKTKTGTVDFQYVFCMTPVCAIICSDLVTDWTAPLFSM